jgi:hypothetical protein
MRGDWRVLLTIGALSTEARRSPDTPGESDALRPQHVRRTLLNGFLRCACGTAQVSTRRDVLGQYPRRRVELNTLHKQLRQRLCCHSNRLPGGVGALDLTRITWSPFEGHFFRSENITTYSIAISVRYQQQAPKFLGIANQSQHEIILAAPVRLNRTADETIFGTYGCSSGIVGYAPTCSGTLYFTGTPASN